MPRIISIANQKGGVGKTATTLGICSALLTFGYRVLALDVDQQANLTDVLLPEEPDGPGILGLMGDPRFGGGAALADTIVAAGPKWPGLWIVPGSNDLASVDADSDRLQPYRLRKAFREGADALERFDLVVIDCPPSVGKTLGAALIASTDVLIVTEPEHHSVQGVPRIEQTMAEIHEITQQPTPQLLGIVINKVSGRLSEHAFQQEQLRTEYGELVCEQMIGSRVAVKDATASATPIHSLTSSRGARHVAHMFDALVDELVSRLPIRVTDQLQARRRAQPLSGAPRVVDVTSNAEVPA